MHFPIPSLDIIRKNVSQLDQIRPPFILFNLNLTVWRCHLDIIDCPCTVVIFTIMNKSNKSLNPFFHQFSFFRFRPVHDREAKWVSSY